MKRSSETRKTIQASRERVYNAFVDPKALEVWLAPNGMTGKIHSFELRTGGGYGMSLFYNNDKIAGKTTGNEDRFLARYIELNPFEKIIQSIHFHSNKSDFQDEMIMEINFDEINPTTTKVTMVHKNIPIGVTPKQNKTGVEQSLEKLKRYLTEPRSRVENCELTAR